MISFIFNILVHYNYYHYISYLSWNSRDAEQVAYNE